MTSEKDKSKKPGKILCGSCKKACKGSVLKVQEKYFHLDCFKCHKCKCSLAKGGFFCKDNRYYCSTDYQTLYGTKCAVCKQFVQGEVVTALGKTYHQKCFACSKCNKIFVYGQKVIYTKNQCVCAGCMEAERSPTNQAEKEVPTKKKKIKKNKNNNTKSASLPLLDKKLGTKKSDKSKEIKNSLKNSSKNDQNFDKLSEDNCAGCKRSLAKPAPILHQSRPASRQKNVQIQDAPVTESTDHATLYALNRHWHENCFRCSSCETPLFNKEYMTRKLDPEAAKDDSQSKLVDSPEHQMTAHCMTCYKAKLSVRCSYCSRIIEGKVLQAGDDLHFHPTCCRCFKCGFLFTNAQEMYVQGKAIWHAHCDGLRYEQLESSYLSPFTRSRSLPRSQPISPFGSLYQMHRTQHISPISLDHHQKLQSLAVNQIYRDQSRRGHTLPSNMSPLSTMHSYSYLTSTEPNSTYLRKPLQPQAGTSQPQYHLPIDYPYRSRSNFSRSSSATRSSPNLMSGMRAMVDSLRPHYRSISPSERSIRRAQQQQLAIKQLKAVKTRLTSTTNTTLDSDQIDKDLSEKDKSQNLKKDQVLDDLSDENPPSDNSSNFRQQLLDASTDEVIDLSHYPPARRPVANELAPIERDDFPAPPYATNISRTSHRSASSQSGRRSTSRTRVRPCTNSTIKTMNSNGNTSEDDVDEEKVDEIDSNESDLSDPLELARRQQMHDQLKREELELKNLGHGIGQVFLDNLKDREKRLREYHIDPRNTSRTPSARTPLPRRLRYDNPVNDSPSRDLDHYMEDEELDQFSLYRGTNTRSSNYTAPAYNIIAQRNVPKPGYSLKKDNTNYTYNKDLEKTQSIDFNCNKSDSAQSHTRPGMSAADFKPPFKPTPTHFPPAEPPADKVFKSRLEPAGNRLNRSISIGYGLSPYSDCRDLYRASLMRNSMPNVSMHKSNEPPKLYPYHILITTNYRLPDVDRCHLEAHLSNEEFEALFAMTRLDFYRLPGWRRNEL